MAERRGGHRDPGARQPASGPGAFSSRTDGQTIQAPDLDRPDIQQGDVQMLQDAQRAVPLATGASLPAGGGGGGAPLPPLEALREGGGLPGFLTGDTARPEEPMSAGSPFGAGPGPEVLSTPTYVEDDFEALLEYFATNYSDVDAVEALNEIRGGAGGIPSPAAAPIAAPGEPMADEELDDTEGLDVGDDFSDMDFEDNLGPAMPPEDVEADLDALDEDVDDSGAPEEGTEDVPGEAAPADEAPVEDE